MMTATYDLNSNGVLLLRADPLECEAIRQMRADHPNHGDAWAESEALESLLANSELEWIAPEDCGALTDAPILGVWEYNEDGHQIKVLAAWGFMDYQVRSFLDDLIETGRAVFTS